MVVEALRSDFVHPPPRFMGLEIGDPTTADGFNKRARRALTRVLGALFCYDGNEKKWLCDNVLNNIFHKMKNIGILPYLKSM